MSETQKHIFSKEFIAQSLMSLNSLHEIESGKAHPPLLIGFKDEPNVGKFMTFSMSSPVSLENIPTTSWANALKSATEAHDFDSFLFWVTCQAQRTDYKSDTDTNDIEEVCFAYVWRKGFEVVEAYRIDFGDKSAFRVNPNAIPELNVDYNLTAEEINNHLQTLVC